VREDRHEPEPSREPYPRATRHEAEPPREEKPMRGHPFPSLQTFPARPAASDPPRAEAYRSDPYSHDAYAAPGRPEPVVDRYPGFAAPEPEPAPSPVSHAASTHAPSRYPAAYSDGHPTAYAGGTYPTAPDQHYPADDAAEDRYVHPDAIQPEAAHHDHEHYADEAEHDGAYDPRYAAAAEDDQYDDYDDAPAEEDAYDDEPGNKRGKFLKIGLAALGVVVFGTAAAFGYRMVFHGGSDGPPPLIRADNSPTKVIPPSMADASAKPINDRLGGERMVSREEQPIDLRDAGRNGNGVVAPVAGGGVAPYPSAPSTTSAAPASAAATEPKRVRTVTIRADAGTSATDRTAPAMMTLPTATAPRPAAPAAAAPAAPAAQNPQPTVAAVDTTRPAAPPRARPTEGGWIVQISAQKTEAEAQAAFRTAQAKFSVLAGYQPLIRKKDQGERGVFYATQVGPVPREEANQLCENLKTAGGNCFIQKN
jgi:cell division septation protein DedD